MMTKKGAVTICELLECSNGEVVTTQGLKTPRKMFNHEERQS